MERLAVLEDARSLGGGFAEAMVSSSDPAIRVRALRVLARLQRLESLPAIEKGLRDGEGRVRDEAAFALGLLGLSWDALPADRSRQIEAILLRALEAEKIPAVRVTSLESLGKTGGADSFPVLRSVMSSGAAAERAAAGVSLGVIAYRWKGKVWDASLETVLATASDDADTDVRFGATYAAMRACRADAPIRPALVDLLRRHLDDPDPDVRANAARGLGEVAGDDDLGPLAKAVGDPVPRVGAEAARALAKTAGRCKTDPCLAGNRLAQTLAGATPLAAVTRVAALSDPVGGAAMEAAARRVVVSSMTARPGTIARSRVLPRCESTRSRATSSCFPST